MKNQLLATILLLLMGSGSYTSVWSQVFRQIEGPFSEMKGDSRSVNFIDINNDDWPDIYISNGKKGGQSDVLFINLGKGKLKILWEGLQGQKAKPSDGASFADLNQDGFVDGVVSSWYDVQDELLWNNPERPGFTSEVQNPLQASFGETAIIGDYDQDSHPDIYVTNSGGTLFNLLYRNQGDGSFALVENHTLTQGKKASRGATWGDFNGDGYSDLFICNEGEASNDLYWGKGGGKFDLQTEGALVRTKSSSITASWGDIDNDGDLDVFVGNAGYFAPQTNQLFINEGGIFVPKENSPLSQEADCVFGSAFADFDNDGDLDLAISRGYCPSGLKNALYENQGDGSFKEVSHLLDADNKEQCSYGVAWGDINRDGFLDLVVANCKNRATDEEPGNTLLLNPGNQNNWIALKLIGKAPNTSALGTRVKLKALIDGKEVWQMRELQSQSGYAGQNSMILHFGLGQARRIDYLEVNWTDGKKEV
ncbi:MAG: CRTAC1 family protein, partial [Bacteroidota bacterium]